MGLIVQDFAARFIVYLIPSPGSCRRKSLSLTRKSDLKGQLPRQSTNWETALSFQLESASLSLVAAGSHSENPALCLVCWFPVLGWFPSDSDLRKKWPYLLFEYTWIHTNQNKTKNHFRSGVGRMEALSHGSTHAFSISCYFLGGLFS